MESSISPYSFQHLLLSDILIPASLVGVKSQALICVSLMARDTDRLFMCSLAIYISSSEKHLFKSFDHFLVGLSFMLSCRSSLHIQDIKSSSDTGFANIFFHYVGCLSTFLIVSFEAQTILILMKYNLSIFNFVAHAFGVIPKNPLPNPRSLRFTLCFFPKCFIVSSRTFRSLMHFEIIFEYFVR